MREVYATALGRALSYCSSMTDGSIEGLVERAAWELHHECMGEFASLAFIMRRSDGSSFVGRPREQAALPAETLLGLLIEESGGTVSCRVRDHALDVVRFIDARFRTSIVVRIMIPSTLLQGGEAALWFGLQGAATPKRVEQAQEIASVVTQWFDIYTPSVKAIQNLSNSVASLRARLNEMTAVAHDARAPIGALKYLVADVAAVHPELTVETEALQQELVYVNRLLMRFSPTGREADSRSDASQCDVSAVMRRVASRYGPEALERRITIRCESPYGGVRAQISELDCERIVSNILGNAVRYANEGGVVVELADTTGDGVVVRVKDEGPGIPRAVIDRVMHGDIAPEPVGSGGGWGVGLVSCSARLRQLGGALRISSSPSGSTVEVVLPQVRGALEQRRGELVVKDSGDGHVQERSTSREQALVIIDDDVEHTASLERVLQRVGVSVVSFASVDAALEAIQGASRPRIICDAHMPDGGAERLLKILAGQRRAAQLAVISGEASEESMYRFAALGARAFFGKPIEVDQLVAWARS